MVQGELFKEEPVFNASSNNRAQSFLSQYNVTLSLDKLVLIFIGFVVVFVLTFSFGVEKGKRAAEKRLESLIPAQVANISTSQEKPLSADPQEEVVLNVKQTGEIENVAETSGAAEENAQSTPKISELPSVSSDKGKYTIQLVTYLSSDQASKEIERLKAKGYDGFVIPSGSHVQVCVGYFKSTSQAKQILGRIRSEGRYPDAYVRPVVR